MLKPFVFFFVISTSAPLLISCGGKSLSDRDIRREQLRLNAQKRRVELEGLVGFYRGQLHAENGTVQDTSLRLDVKDVPETEDGKIDPVLVPILDGSMSFTYGVADNFQLINFSASKAEYDHSTQKLDMIVGNSQFKEVNLSLEQESDFLSGTWFAPASSTAGTVKFEKTPRFELEGTVPSLKASYEGFMNWDNEDWSMRSVLTLNTSQDEADGFHGSANLTMIAEREGLSETYNFSYDQIEFNPLSRQLTIQSDSSDVFLIGMMGDGEVLGKWHSKRYGALGSFALSSQNKISKPKGNTLFTPVAGTYYGSIRSLRPDISMPERLMISFATVPQGQESGGLGVKGSARLYFGPFSSDEYQEYNFASIENVLFKRKMFASTDGVNAAKLTFEIDAKDDGFKGIITDSSLGRIGEFEVSHAK